jgi:hypothetical protein
MFNNQQVEGMFIVSMDGGMHCLIGAAAHAKLWLVLKEV